MMERWKGKGKRKKKGEGYKEEREGGTLWRLNESVLSGPWDSSAMLARERQ